MAKKVDGFLAEDGTFFSIESECQRYEHYKQIESLCVTHGINFENFVATLNAWHQQIKGYYDADDQCEGKWIKEDHTLNFEPDFINGDTTDDISLLRTEGDQPYAAIGDKDAPGFLEQSFRKRK